MIEIRPCSCIPLRRFLKIPGRVVSFLFDSGSSWTPWSSSCRRRYHWWIIVILILPHISPQQCLPISNRLSQRNIFVQFLSVKGLGSLTFRTGNQLEFGRISSGHFVGLKGVDTGDAPSVATNSDDGCRRRRRRRIGGRGFGGRCRVGILAAGTFGEMFFFSVVIHMLLNFLHNGFLVVFTARLFQLCLDVSYDGQCLTKISIGNQVVGIKGMLHAPLDQHSALLSLDGDTAIPDAGQFRFSMIERIGFASPVEIFQRFLTETVATNSHRGSIVVRLVEVRGERVRGCVDSSQSPKSRQSRYGAGGDSPR